MLTSIFKALRRTLLMLIALMVFASPALARVERNEFLDVAFTCLEKDNPFLLRYNQITGAEVEPLFELGVPYFFGGKADKRFWTQYPRYSQRHPYQNVGPYTRDKLMIYGLDCSGYTCYIYTEAGYPAHDALMTMITRTEREHHIYTHHEGERMPEDFTLLADTLEVGDLFVAAHPNLHVLMFIGTLADYGFTAADNPKLEKYLEYPLVIHAGENPQVADRFTNLILTDEFYSDCYPTYGGVCVSILGMDPADADVVMTSLGKTYPGLVLDDKGTILFDWTLELTAYYCWYRRPTVKAADLPQE